MKIILFLPFFLANTIVFSQVVPKNKIKAGTGLTLAIPVYNLDLSKTGGGIDGIIHYGLTNKLNITADVGFIGLPGVGRFPSTAIIPIRVGLRYFPSSKFYMGAKTGLGIYSILKASANHFAYSLASGYFITRKIDASIIYDGYTNNNTSFGYVGIRAGFTF